MAPDIEKQIADKIFRVAVDAAQSKPIDEERVAHDIMQLVNERTRSLENVAAIAHHQNTEMHEVLHIAKEYYRAAESANATARAYGRQGASGSAYELINRARLRAKTAHEALLAAIGAIDRGAPLPVESLPTAERPEDI